MHGSSRGSCWQARRGAPWSRIHPPRTLPSSVACPALQGCCCQHCLSRPQGSWSWSCPPHPIPNPHQPHPEKQEERLVLCSLEGGTGHNTTALRCPGDHSLVGESGAVSWGPPHSLKPFQSRLQSWREQSSSPITTMAFILGVPWQEWGIGFTATSCLLDAPIVTNQIFLGVGGLRVHKSYLQTVSYLIMHSGLFISFAGW